MVEVTFNIHSRQTYGRIIITCISYSESDSHYILDFGSHSHVYPRRLIKHIKNINAESNITER